MWAAIRRAAPLQAAAMLASLLGLGSVPLAMAQGQAPPEAGTAVSTGRFLAFAHSSATLQERASALAASRGTRPEVKAFAEEMARFRGEQIRRLPILNREKRLVGIVALGDLATRTLASRPAGEALSGVSKG